VEAVAAGNFPVLALGGCGIEQPRIPSEWHGDDASVAQRHAQRVVGERNVTALAHLLLLPKNSFHAPLYG